MSGNGGISGVKNTQATANVTHIDNKETNKELRLDQTSKATRITLDQFAGIEGRVEDAPSGTGTDSVKKQRQSVGNFFSGLLADVKSLLGAIEDFFNSIGKKDKAKGSDKPQQDGTLQTQGTAKTKSTETEKTNTGTGKTGVKTEVAPQKPLTDEEKKIQKANDDFKAMTNGDKKVPDDKIGLMFALAEDSGSDANMLLAVKKAVANGVEQHRLDKTGVTENGFAIELKGNKSGVYTRQLSDAGLEKVKEIATSLLGKANEVETDYINQLLDMPTMGEQIGDSFMTHVLKDSASTFLRGNTFFTTELALGAQNGIKVDIGSVLGNALKSEDGVKLLKLINDTKELEAQKENEIKALEERTPPELRKSEEYISEVLKLRKEQGEIKDRIATTPKGDEAAELVGNIVSYLIDELIGDGLSSVKYNSTEGFTDTLSELAKQISETTSLKQEDRETKIDSLYQNAFALRGLCPMLTDLTTSPSFKGNQRQAILMISQVFQMAANDTLLNDSKPQAIKDKCADLGDKFSTAITELMNYFNAPPVEGTPSIESLD